MGFNSGFKGLKQENVCECVFAYIGLNLMLDAQLVYEITNAIFIQLSVSHPVGCLRT